MRRKMFLLPMIALSALLFSMTASAQQRFIASMTGAQEVPATNSTGRGICRVDLNAAETQITVNVTYSGLTSNVVASHIHDAGPVGVNGPVRFNFNFTGGTSGTIGPLTFAPTAQQILDLRAHKWYCNIHTNNFGGGEIRGQVKPVTQSFDFDGDGRTDVRVLRAADSGFYTLNSLTNAVTYNSFGGASTINSSNDDYDGDGRGDFVTFFAQGSARLWHILQTGSNSVRDVQWGSTAATDQVLPADYDGDGKADIAVFRRTEGNWYIVRSSDNTTQAIPYGAVNDIAAVGDFDKDGISDLTGIRSTANGVGWFTRLSSTGATQVVLWGGAVAPVADSIFTAAQLDFDGDGRQDHMVVRDPDNTVTGSPSTFFIRRSSDGQPYTLQWGVDTDTKLFGDYDGDGKTDVVARRNENGQFVWYIFQSSTQTGRAVPFGATNDVFTEERDDDPTVFEIH